MIDEKSPEPECFGNLDTVFPLGADGLRHTPGLCLACGLKTSCLRNAVSGAKGLAVQEEVLERSYKAGLTGFCERWSRKKALHRIQRNLKD
jgi:hypothetical protein